MTDPKDADTDSNGRNMPGQLMNHFGNHFHDTDGAHEVVDISIDDYKQGD